MNLSSTRVVLGGGRVGGTGQVCVAWWVGLGCGQGSISGPRSPDSGCAVPSELCLLYRRCRSKEPSGEAEASLSARARMWRLPWPLKLRWIQRRSVSQPVPAQLRKETKNSRCFLSSLPEGSGNGNRLIVNADRRWVVSRGVYFWCVRMYYSLHFTEHSGLTSE